MHNNYQYCVSDKKNKNQIRISNHGYRQSKISNGVHAIALIAILCLVIQTTGALDCYTCSYLETDMDNTCVMDPKSVRVTNCTKKYCTIVRQEATRPAGKVVSFIRDCLDKPLYLNAVKTDSTFKTYYRSCTSDLCNDSDGTHTATNMDPNFGAADNTIIKGKNAGVSFGSNNSIILILINAVLLHVTITFLMQ